MSIALPDDGTQNLSSNTRTTSMSETPISQLRVLIIDDKRLIQVQ
jgi:hypothetical protein